MLNFPSPATPGQAFNQFVYDGAKWTQGNATFPTVVQSFNTRTGDVSLQQSDVANVGFITSATSDARYVDVAGDTMSGGLNVGNGAAIHDPLQIDVAQGYYARIRHNVRNVRLWTAGTDTGGKYVIADESGATYRITIDTAGQTRIVGNLLSDGTIQTNNGRIVSYRSDVPSVVVYQPGYAGGMWCDSTGNISFGWANGDGSPVDSKIYLRRSDGMVISNGGIYAVGQINADSFQNRSGRFYTYNTGNYYFQRESTGNWGFVENGGWIFRVEPNGSGWFAGNVLVANDGNFGLLNAAGLGRQLRWDPSNFIEFNWTDASTNHSRYGNNWWSGRSDLISSNYAAYVAGIGAYANWSDAGLKTDIEDWTASGLDAVRKLRPRRFTRKKAIGDPHHTPEPRVGEIGFVAQEVRGVLPDAVVELPIPPNTLPMDGATALAIQLDPIVGALVNAVQELTTRLEALEKRA